MTGPSARRSLRFTAPRRVGVAEDEIPRPSSGELLVETIVSAISPGTELLTYRDEVPAGMQPDGAPRPPVDPPAGAQPYASAEHPGGSAFPVKHGYSAIGRVTETGPGVSRDWSDSIVFCLHPHESHFLARPQDLAPVPDGVHTEDAAMFANFETAVTLVMDGRPMIGERVAILGQGVVGLLTTALLAEFPLAGLVSFDLHPLRRRLSRELGSHEAIDPADGLAAHQQTYDLVYELSGSPQVLDQAIALTRFNGRVVIGSWYGERRAPIDLGGAFHRSRIALLSSQVSTIDPALSGRWNPERRRQATWSMLSRVQPQRIVTHRFPLAAAPDAYDLLDRHPDEAVQVLLTYGA
jgi:NADPH:quinone reductase-like Zn-dependent oxidoreductase